MAFENLFADFTTVMWIALAVGAFLFINGLTGKGKNKKSGKNMLFGGLVIIGLTLFAPGIFSAIDFGSTPATIGTTGTTSSVVSGLCAVDKTTVTFNAFDEFTSAATGGTHAYKINGGSRQTVGDTSTASLSPGDSIEVLWLNEAETSGYFGKLDTFTIPCKGTFIAESDLVQNGSLTLNIFNEEGNIIDGSAENETLTTGDVANLKVEVRAANQQGYPFGGILTLELNGTAFDEENIELTFNDLSATKVPTPSVHTITSTERKTISWELPAFTGASLHTGTLILDVADSAAPIDSADDPVFTWRPAAYFVNQDNGNSFDGPAVEDEDNVATVNYAPTVTLSVD